MKKRGMRMAVAGVFILIALAGCDPDALSIKIGQTTRTYQLYVPENLPAEPVPLVLALHPLLLNGGQMRRMTGFDEIANREGFIVAYPNGRWRRWDVLPVGGQDLEFLTALIDTLIVEHNVDPSRVFAAGASNGAMMCHLLACRAPGRIAAIAAVMGTPPRAILQQCAPETKMPVLIIHGVEDSIVPYEGNAVFYSAPDTAAFWARQNGGTGEPLTKRLPEAAPQDGTSVDYFEYDCGEGPPVALYRVNGGGHTWPGATFDLPRFIVGRTSREINASELAWEFFSAQTARE